MRRRWRSRPTAPAACSAWRAPPSARATWPPLAGSIASSWTSWPRAMARGPRSQSPAAPWRAGSGSRQSREIQEDSMRRISAVTVLTLTILGLPALAVTQEEPVHAVSGGGISAPGWQGAVDARDAARGRTVKDAKLAKQGDALHVTTGPAAIYWNPANTAQGDYTVKATFTEPKYMNLNDHPHPYGVFIAGNDLGTDHESLLLRGVWERERHRARVRPTLVSDERAWGRVQRRGAQGGRAGEARHAGDRAVGQGRQGRMHGE